jgi:hypothetical protein
VGVKIIPEATSAPKVANGIKAHWRSAREWRK